MELNSVSQSLSPIISKAESAQTGVVGAANDELTSLIAATVLPSSATLGTKVDVKA